MLDMFNQLINRGWKLDNHYVRNSVFILTFKKDKYVLHIWDTTNYTKFPLKEIGKIVDLDKLDIDFNQTTDKALEIYCMRDTEILYKYIKKLVTFLEKYELSQLKATAGSLSFSIFRNKFYKQKTKPIFIHNWKQAIKLERESYKGGITDCFQIGKYDNLYKLDINSMYPSVMKDIEVPVKLEAYLNQTLSQDKLFKIFDIIQKENYGYIISGNFTIPKEKAYILANFGLGKSSFAYGSYDLVLCEPEVRFLLENEGKLNEIYEMNVYTKKNVFQEFVSFFYELKKEFKKKGNKVDEGFCKLILNTQYGKWGQRKVENEVLDKKHQFLIQNQEIILDMIESKQQQIQNNSIIYLGSVESTEPK
jgi:DNA polymerase elongation subunit (family B)